MQNIDNENDEITFVVTDKSQTAFSLIPLYEDVFKLMQVSEHFHPRKFEVEPFEILNKLFSKYKSNFGIQFSDDEKVRVIQEQVLYHIEGVLVGPTVVMLGIDRNVSQVFYGKPLSVPKSFTRNPNALRKYWIS